MKREYTYCTLLGISQQDAAMLFGVTRVQWSMFEIGQRDLPLAATQLLGEILTYVQAPENTSKRPNGIEQKATQNQAQKLLLENEYQRLLLEKKIATAEKKQETQMRLARLMAFLDSHQAKKGNAADNSRQFVTGKAAQFNAIDHDAVLTKFKLKQELLHHERLLLESKIKKQ